MTAYIRRTWRTLSAMGRVGVVVGLTIAAFTVAWGQGQDSDGDGMPDSFEVFWGLDPQNSLDAALDPDLDELSNLGESELWTDPLSADTDWDGVNDGVDSNPVSRAYFGFGDDSLIQGDSYTYTWPSWVVGAFKDGGDWDTNALAWHVDGSAEEGCGRLCIELDRGFLTNDLRLRLDLFDHTNASLYVDLYGTNEVVLNTNLFGNLCAGINAERQLLVALPLADAPEAVGILMRRGEGEITVHSALLYVDEDGDGLDAEQELQFGSSDASADTDGDGYDDSDEVLVYGTDPLDDESIPEATLSGSVTYTGELTGTVWVVAAETSDGMGRIFVTYLDAPGNYAITGIPLFSNVWVTAFLDANANNGADPYEPWGESGISPVAMTGSVGGVNVTLLSPDNGGIPEAGLRLWLPADLIATNHGVPVLRWPDRSGWGHDATQLVTSLAPVYVTNALNGKPAVAFDGTNDYLAGQVGGMTGAVSVIAVCRFDKLSQPSGDYDYLMRIGENTALRQMSVSRCATGYATDWDNAYYSWMGTASYKGPALAGQSWMLVSVVHGGTGASHAVWIDGEWQPAGQYTGTLLLNGALELGRYSSGSTGNHWLDGQVAELLVYDRGLSGEEREVIEGYLKDKYAINTPPRANAGADQMVPEGQTATLEGAVTDDGLPLAPGVVTSLWSKVAGSGDVTFGDAAAPETTASFGAAGAYRLRLWASDGERAASDDVDVVVLDSASTNVTASGRRLWLRADALVAEPGEGISRWRDVSGQGHDATQLVTSLAPVYVTNALNGKPAVAFDGTNDYLAGQVGGMTGAVSVIAVCRFDKLSQPSGDYDYLMRIGENTALRQMSVSRSATGYATDWDNAYYSWMGTASYKGPALAGQSWMLVSVVHGGTGASHAVWIDGEWQPAEQYTGTLLLNGALELGRYSSGSTGNHWLDGQVAELLVYDRGLTGGEREVIEGYLKDKYAINTPPRANTGADQMVSEGQTASLEGAVTDDGLPLAPGVVTSLWSKVAGPGDVTFGDAAAPQTTASFGAAGAYRLRLWASDGERAASDDVDVVVLDSASTNVTASGRRLWLRADALVAEPGEGISRWRDVSGQGHDATQLMTSLAPVYVANALNGKPAVAFDGTNDYLAGQVGTISGAVSVIAVCRFDKLSQPSGDYDYLMRIGENTALRQMSVSRCATGYATDWDNAYYSWMGTASYKGPALAGQSWMLMSVVHGGTGASHAVWIDGEWQPAEQYTGTLLLNGALELGRYSSGSTGNHWLDGQVAELLVYDRALTGEEREVVEEYLIGKYWPPIDEDTDQDGLPDSWEEEYFGDLSQAGSGDPDADGLTNLQEFLYGTDPTSLDTDGDGLSDGYEIFGQQLVVCWGDNEEGQTSMPSGLDSVVAIADGGYHNLALKADGTVLGWGADWFGQADVPPGLSNVVAIAGGDVHSMALQSDGTVVCWGYNEDGETDVPLGLTDVVAIASGDYHSLALQSNGTVVCWGANWAGQTVVPSELSNVMAIAGGGSHSMALQSDGTVVCWGDNEYDQAEVPSGLIDVVAIAGGGSHSMALQSDGTVVCWGDSEYDQAEVPSGLTDVVAIASGGYHSLALQSNGTVVGWGYNDYGQTDVPPGLSHVVAIAAGGYHSLALVIIRLNPTNADTDEDGSSDGLEVAAGTDPLNGSSFPADISGTVAYSGGQTGLIRVVAVTSADSWSTNWSVTLASPGSYSLVNLPNLTNYWLKAWVDTDGDGARDDWEPNGSCAMNPVYLTEDVANAGIVIDLDTDADGLPDWWELDHFGDLDPTPSADADGDGLTNLAEYQLHTDPTQADTDGDGVRDDVDPNPTSAADTDVDGLPDDWEQYWFGNLDQTGSDDPDADGLTNLQEYPYGADPTAVDTDGDGLSDGFEVFYRQRIVCWGDNEDGQTDVPSELTGVVAIAGGRYHNLALKSDGTVVGWGANWAGQTDVPPDLSNVVAIAGGGYHSLSLKSDGTVVCWGDNEYDQAEVPSGLSSVVAIAGGSDHSVALRSDGTVVCWGDSEDGQADVPSGLNDVVAIAGGRYHSLALKSDGAVVCWGNGSYGQTDVPPDLDDAVAIAAGGYHSMALRSDGTVVCWGANWYGQADVPSGLSDVTAIAAGGYHSMALRSDGTVVCWGDDDAGQAEVPTGLGNVAGIAGGSYHSTALVIIRLNPTNADTDEDGSSDGLEVAAGTDPLNGSSFPADISGTVAYSGGQTGLIRVVAVTSADSWSTNWSVTLASPGSYSLVNLPNLTNYWLKAWVDTDGDGARDDWEPNGSCAMNPAYLTEDVANAGIVIDLDTDADGLPDWWELDHFGDLDPTPSADADGDGLTNLAEYQLHTDPTQADTDGDGVQDDVDPNPTSAADTDADGLPDDWEVVWFGNLDQTGSDDPDADGLTNRQEHRYGTNPASSDTDGDGLSDSFEMFGRQQLVCWGNNWDGQTEVPSGLSNVLAIAGGGYHSLALQSNGTVVCWGDNWLGQTDVPSGLSDVVAIAGGFYHSTALRSDGTAVCWGDNEEGQTEVPTGLGDVRAIAAGDWHNVALRSDGTVVCWPGDGQALPQSVSNVVAISAGGSHSMALRSDGTVVCWGSGWYGQTNVPSGLSGVVAIAGGGVHSMALKSDGTVVCWGDNDYGQTDVPSGLSNVVAIAAGDYHSMAMQSDGTVVCWGHDGYGQSDAPSGLRGAVAIAGGGYHSMALTGLDPANPDTDEDEAWDGLEVGLGTDPLDPGSFPAGISGTVAYSGGQTGRVWVVAVASSNSWSTNWSATLASPGSYSITNLPNLTNYWLKAWRDTDGDGAHDYWEANGSCAMNPMYLTNNASNIDITLSDPDDDTDADGLPDWWEIRYFGNATAAVPSEDPDDDDLINLQEYQYGTDPGNSDTDGDGLTDSAEIITYGTDPLNGLSFPVDIAGAVTYSGSQTGLVWVVAVTSSNSWGTNRSAVLTSPGSYSIANLPNLTNYWLKAWRDTDGDGVHDYWEAGGASVSNPTYLTTGSSNIDITLLDPPDDADSDDMPDWWEIYWFGTVTNQVGTQDYDADALDNSGEYSHGTCPANSDSDGDGVQDGTEVAVGSDPLNSSSFPADISGTVGYSGSQTGLFWVVAVTSSNSWSANWHQTLSSAGAYSVTNLPNLTNYWLKSWRDTDGDGVHDYWEPSGSYATNPVYLTTNVLGKSIALGDPDTDADGLPDWWEVWHFGDIIQTPTDDYEGDGVNNLQEFLTGTDPGNPDTDGDRVPDGADPSPMGLADTDSDGLADDWEQFWFGNLSQGPADDPDVDGWDNALEFKRGGNPLQAWGPESNDQLRLRVSTPLRRGL